MREGRCVNLIERLKLESELKSTPSEGKLLTHAHALTWISRLRFQYGLRIRNCVLLSVLRWQQQGECLIETWQDWSRPFNRRHTPAPIHIKRLTETSSYPRHRVTWLPYTAGGLWILSIAFWFGKLSSWLTTILARVTCDFTLSVWW